MLGELVPGVLFSCDGFALMCFLFLLIMHTCFCESYCVGSVAMAMVVSTKYSAKGPWSTISC